MYIICQEGTFLFIRMAYWKLCAQNSLILVVSSKQKGILHLTYCLIRVSSVAGYMCWSNLLFVIYFITFIHFPFCTFVLGSLLLWSLYSLLPWTLRHLCTVSDFYITVFCLILFWMSWLSVHRKPCAQRYQIIGMSLTLI